jgi:TonB-linked SusC/RagA family outer membrane protein
MKKSLLLLLALTFCGLLSYGQNVTIKGQVTTSDQMGLPGVTIFEKGTTKGTVTKPDGSYEIEVSSSDAIISFSFIGFVPQEVAIAGKTTIDVVLNEDTQDLDEVIVVGYGTQKKANITGAAASVKMDKVLGNRPVTNAAVAIQGSIPGLQVVTNSGQPGSEGVNLNIRGVTSLNGGGPLVLMDNVPVSMADVNPQDIESVTVLKDAAASSIYGARAAFGVILITTKKGGKDQPVKFEYSNTFSFRQAEDVLEKASTYDFVHALDDWGLDAFWTGPDVPTWIEFLDDNKENPGNYPDGYAEKDGLRYPLTDTDLIGAFLNDPGFTQIHNFSFAGGSAKTAYRVSAGFSDEDGIIVTDSDSFKKYNVTSYLKTDITDKISVTADFKYNNDYRRTPKGQYGNAISFNPFTPPDGYHEMEDGSMVPYDSPAMAERIKVIPERWRDNVRLFGKVDYTPIKNLTFTAEYTFSKLNQDNVSGDNQVLTVNPERFTLNAVDPARTFHQKSNSKTIYKGLNFYAKYKKNFQNHNFEVLVGSNRENQDYEYFRARRYNLVDVNLPALGTATGIIEADDSFYQWAVMGYFGRINYNYMEKYFVEINARYDGSSRFAADDRWGFFPSISAGWNIARESFMEDVELISQLKLRGSWGEVGNQLTNGYYPYVPGMPLYEASWLNEGALQQYSSLDSPALVSAGFTWEAVRTINLGIDIKMLKNRLSSSFDIFQRETLGMLESGVELPALLGTSAPQQNSADLKTTGWEFEASWNDRVGKVSYNVGVTLWDNQSEITKFDSETGIIGQPYVGQQRGEMWGYVTDGYYTVDDFVEGSLDEDLMNGTLIEGLAVPKGRTINPGDVKFADLNNDGEIFTGNNTLAPAIDPVTGEVVPGTGPGDRQIIGNNTRRYQFGVFANAEYKGFDFSLMFNGIGKRDIYINNQTRFPYTNEFQVVYVSQLDYWTPENTETFYPRNYPLGAVNYGYSRSTQTKYMLNGAYMRIKNITLGYTLPQKIMEKLRVDKLRVYVAAENVADFNSWPNGINTELSNKGSGATYPYMKGYSFGLNVTF